MATGRDVAEKNLEDLEKEITCAVCRGHYTDPKILPCLHYYCKQCILRLALRTCKDEPFSCPECRKDTKLPEGGVEELKSAFFVNRLKSIHARHKKALSKGVLCELCSGTGAKAEAYCRQCDKFACKNCVQSHSVINRSFEDHKIISVEEFDRTEDEKLLLKIPINKCTAHNEPLKYFCFDCSALICGDCIVKYHIKHNVEFCNTAADNKKSELLQSLNPLREVEHSLSYALEELSNTEQEIKAQEVSVVNTITTSFEELHTILETRKRQLLEEAERRVKEKIESLKAQKEYLSVVSGVVRSVIDYTKQYVSYSSDEEVMSTHAEISHRIHQEIEEHRKRPQNSLKPVEEADMGVEVMCAVALQQLCQTKANVVLIPFKVEIYSAPMNEECEAILQLKRRNYEEARSSPTTVKCHLTYSSNFVIRQIAHDKYHILFQSGIRGRRELSISVNSQPVLGSPFPVAVSTPATQLDGKPFLLCEDISGPLDIAVNSAGEIIVVGTYGRNIICMHREGKQLSRIECLQYDIKHVRAVCLDKEDNIFFIDHYSNKIGKASRNCKRVQVHEVLQEQGPGHNDIVVVGDEVMVIERNNEGQIMTYDRELNYIRRITSKGNTRFRCLYPDCYQNLYISDDDKNIQVLNKAGDFLYSFMCTDYIKQLRDPWRVHVFGHLCMLLIKT